jgi:hypothetical protein
MSSLHLQLRSYHRQNHRRQVLLNLLPLHNSFVAGDEFLRQVAIVRYVLDHLKPEN